MRSLASSLFVVVSLGLAAVTLPAAPVLADPSAQVPPVGAASETGRIHVVVPGDTLWDISNTYLGTPWVWPSIWKDNGDIQNPHLILPGDHIWITRSEMRIVTPEEAARLLADAGEAAPPAAQSQDVPSEAPVTARKLFRFPGAERVGIVDLPALRGAGRVIGSPEEHVWLTENDILHIDLGKDRTKVGDQFTVFRTVSKVRDPDTRKKIGYHTDILAWIEVVEVYEQSARATVRMSYSEVIVGDRLVPRIERPTDIAIQDPPFGVDGAVVEVPALNRNHAEGDVVYLNRGAEDGLVVGSPLEVYRPAEDHWKEAWFGSDRPTEYIPAEVVGKLLVVTVNPRTAAAIVTTTAGVDVVHGDRFRAVGTEDSAPPPDWKPARAVSLDPTPGRGVACRAGRARASWCLEPRSRGASDGASDASGSRSGIDGGDGLGEPAGAGAERSESAADARPEAS